MLKTKTGKQILRCRWGKKRTPSRILRVSNSVYETVHLVKESDRRRWLDDVVLSAFRDRLHSPILAGG